MGVFLLLYAVGLFASYWIIRLAVRHAIEDSRRGPNGALPPPREVTDTIRRQRETYGDSDSE